MKNCKSADSTSTETSGSVSELVTLAPVARRIIGALIGLMLFIGSCQSEALVTPEPELTADHSAVYQWKIGPVNFVDVTANVFRIVGVTSFIGYSIGVATPAGWGMIALLACANEYLHHVNRLYTSWGWVPWWSADELDADRTRAAIDGDPFSVWIIRNPNEGRITYAFTSPDAGNSFWRTEPVFHSFETSSYSRNLPVIIVPPDGPISAGATFHKELAYVVPPTIEYDNGIHLVLNQATCGVIFSVVAGWHTPESRPLTLDEICRHGLFDLFTSESRVDRLSDFQLDNLIQGLKDSPCYEDGIPMSFSVPENKGAIEVAAQIRYRLNLDRPRTDF